jgi:hypothetical protein
MRGKERDGGLSPGAGGISGQGWEPVVPGRAGGLSGGTEESGGLKNRGILAAGRVDRARPVVMFSPVTFSPVR